MRERLTSYSIFTLKKYTANAAAIIIGGSIERNYLYLNLGITMSFLKTSLINLTGRVWCQFVFVGIYDCCLGNINHRLNHLNIVATGSAVDLNETLISMSYDWVRANSSAPFPISTAQYRVLSPSLGNRARQSILAETRTRLNPVFLWYYRGQTLRPRKLSDIYHRAVLAAGRYQPTDASCVANDAVHPSLCELAHGADIIL